MRKELLRHVDRRWEHRCRQEIILLDNRDSFVYNLAHRLAEVRPGLPLVVVRSEKLDLPTLTFWEPRALIISPGPGHPLDAGISVEAVRHFSGRCPILGVCLGHQAIAVAFGGVVEPGHRPMHGKASAIRHEGQGVFAELANPFLAARYHSLIAREPLPDALEPLAWSEEGFVMGLCHREHPTYGVQFHPESILTSDGHALLRTFLTEVDEFWKVQER